MSTVLEIDLSADPVVRGFFQDIVRQVGVPQDAADFMIHQPELPIPIGMGTAIVTGNKLPLGQTTKEVLAVVTDAYFLASIWRLLGTEIRNQSSYEVVELALMNWVYVGAHTPSKLSSIRARYWRLINKFICTRYLWLA